MRKENGILSYENRFCSSLSKNVLLALAPNLLEISRFTILKAVKFAIIRWASEETVPEIKCHEIEYPCHLPKDLRWFPLSYYVYLECFGYETWL